MPLNAAAAACGITPLPPLIYSQRATAIDHKHPACRRRQNSVGLGLYHRSTGDYLAKLALMFRRWTLCLCTYLTLSVPQLYISVHVWPIVQGPQLLKCPLQTKVSSDWSGMGQLKQTTCKRNYQLNYALV